MIPPELFKLLPEGTSVVAVLIVVFAFLRHQSIQDKYCHARHKEAESGFKEELERIRLDAREDQERLIQSHCETNRILAAANKRMSENVCERMDRLETSQSELLLQGAKVQELLQLQVRGQIVGDDD